MSEQKSELTHDEQIALAMRIMAQRHELDLQAGREWQRRQQRIIIIRDRDHYD